MRSFGSDNHSGIHPVILQAIADANKDHAQAYGADPITARATEMIRSLFGGGSDVWFAFNGTGANIIGLRTLTRPYDAIICAETAHIYENEGGAPEALTGCKLKPVPTHDGKLTVQLIEPFMKGKGSEHYSQPKVISISQPTETGTLYTVDEIKTLAGYAHRNGMFLHMDGARFANAVAASGISSKEMVTDTGVDVLSFGGTKNGMMIGEAVVFLREELVGEVPYQRKQCMQLASKMRFIAAQFEAYLRDDLWLKLASHSNNMAAYMASQVAAIPEIGITQKVQSNALFVELPRRAAEVLGIDIHFDSPEAGETSGARWMCSFDTTKEDIDNFISHLKKIISGCR